MAVLEAFVYDLSNSGGFLDNKPKSKKSKQEGMSVGSKSQMSVAGSGEK